MSHKICWIFRQRALGTQQGRTREWWLISPGLSGSHGLSMASRTNVVMPWALIAWEAAGETLLVDVSSPGVQGGEGGDVGALSGESPCSVIQGPIRSSPLVVPAEGLGSRGELLANLLRWWPGLEWGSGPDIAAPPPAPGGCLPIASAAGRSLTAGEKEMKEKGGTSYHLLELSGCISFQHCRTGAGLRGSWWKRRQSSLGNARGLEEGVSGESLGAGKVWVVPKNCQRLEESKSARAWQGKTN